MQVYMGHSACSRVWLHLHVGQQFFVAQLACQACLQRRGSLESHLICTREPLKIPIVLPTSSVFCLAWCPADQAINAVHIVVPQKPFRFSFERMF